MTETGFEPAPFRTGALIQRLRPLGHSVVGLVRDVLFGVVVVVVFCFLESSEFFKLGFN